jgi:hypothetical protein
MRAARPILDPPTLSSRMPPPSRSFTDQAIGERDRIMPIT